MSLYVVYMSIYDTQSNLGKLIEIDRAVNLLSVVGGKSYCLQICHHNSYLLGFINI